MSKVLNLVRVEADRARTLYGEAFEAEEAYARKHGVFPPADHPIADRLRVQLGYRFAASIIEHVVEVAEGAPCTIDACHTHPKVET